MRTKIANEVVTHLVALVDADAGIKIEISAEVAAGVRGETT